MTLLLLPPIMDLVPTPLGLHILPSGSVVDVAEDGLATFVTCDWLVELPTASLYPAEAEWYPDSPSDVYTVVPCGARVRSLDGTLDHTTCAGGHDRHAYGTRECEVDNIRAEINDLLEDGYFHDAADLALATGVLPR